MTPVLTLLKGEAAERFVEDLRQMNLASGVPEPTATDFARYALRAHNREARNELAKKNSKCA